MLNKSSSNEWKHFNFRREIVQAGIPRNQLRLSRARTPAAGAASRKLTVVPSAGPHPAPLPAEQAQPPTERRVSAPQPRPTQRNIALAPLLASPRGPRRPRLVKGGIAPSRPTACARLHWLVAGVGGPKRRTCGAGRARSR